MRWRSLTWVVPLLGVVLVVPTWGRDLPLGLMLVGVVLVGCVLSAVYHAEVVAHRVGEPFGSLVLAVAVTVIEVALIVTLMLTGGSDKAALARDTVFAAVMITCNGIVGGSLLVATRRGRRAVFSAEGSGAALGSIAVLATLSLALPTFTTSTRGPTFTSTQLAFAAVASLVVYGLYVFVLTVRHREQFLPVAVDPASDPASDPAVGGVPAPDDAELFGEQHPDPPGAGTMAASATLLLVALVGVVGLSKAVSPAIEDAVRAGGLPLSFVGVVIALLVLLPEGLAAMRAASRGQVQTSINLAYGSAMASIGLTIPAIALVSHWLDGPLLLGLGPTQLVFLALTVVVSTLTVAPGRATLLQAGVHLTVFAGFLVLAASP